MRSPALVAALENAIAGKTKELSMAEHCPFRRYDALDDVDGDGREDFLVLFTLEGPRGGNHHVSHLAFFSSSGEARLPVRVRTGERGERDPIDVRGERGKVVLSTPEYRAGDPMAVPPGKGGSAIDGRTGACGSGADTSKEAG
ncbi:MAG TPA: hypothetical protein VFS34_08130 [Thermoanaerobaculia bacterium]|nr:hypothetical protein [Thermoanaerobaculia bacterium]